MTPITDYSGTFKKSILEPLQALELVSQFVTVSLFLLLHL